MAHRGHGSMERDLRREIVRAVLVDCEDMYHVIDRYDDVNHHMVAYAIRLFSGDPVRMAIDARLDAELLDDIADIQAERIKQGLKPNRRAVPLSYSCRNNRKGSLYYPLTGLTPPLRWPLVRLTVELSGEIEERRADLLRLGLYDAREDRKTGTWLGVFDRTGRNQEDAADELVREIESIGSVSVVRVFDISE